jgi:predicted amidohydrolase
MNLDSKKSILVGCAQIDCYLGDIPKNFDKHLVFIKEAKAKSCDLLVFPELSLTGYQMADFGNSLAIPADSEILLQLASDVGGRLSVIVGFVEEGPCGLVYSSAALLYKGQVAFVHRKMSLATFGNLEEAKYYAEGRNIRVHRWSREWTISSLLCQDMWQPSLVHVAAMKGTTLFVSPFCSAKGGFGQATDSNEAWDIASKYIAMIYGMPVVLCNRVGSEKGVKYWGGSRVLDPYGKVLAMAGEEEELIFAQLDYGDVKDTRFNHPIVRDCRIDTTIRELKKVAAGDFGE